MMFNHNIYLLDRTGSNWLRHFTVVSRVAGYGDGGVLWTDSSSRTRLTLADVSCSDLVNERQSWAHSWISGAWRQNNLILDDTCLLVNNHISTKTYGLDIL